MQTQSEALYVGADVAKDEVVVACADGSFPVRPIVNQRIALMAFLKGLPAGSCIGMESTGIYHELLANLAHKRGFTVFVLNPKDTRHYAKGVGLRGKTDRVDAQLIARMVEREHAHLHPWIPPTPEQREIARLLKRRATLSSLRQALASADAFVAFTGLDPRPDDSGQHRGKRRLSKRGSSELRRLLYIAAMSARKTATWKPLFEHYRAKGLSTTAVLVILARRIARTAWSVYTYKTVFDPARLTKCLT